jgi:hypothetical protein
MVPRVKPLIYCADIGSVLRGAIRLGADRPRRRRSRDTSWWHTEIIELVQSVADDLDAGRSLALGFECPLFVPVPEEALRLGMARAGETNRSWSARAGRACSRPEWSRSPGCSPSCLVNGRKRASISTGGEFEQTEGGVFLGKPS